MSVFRQWTDHLPPEIELCGIQPPGRENRLREPPFSQISPLVEILAEVLEPSLNLPYALFGHSVGAIVGFELARELRRRYGATPAHFFVSGRRAPQLPLREAPIHQLSDGAFTEALRLYNGTPELVLQESELMQLLLPALRADFTINETYVYSPETPFNCRISAFGGLQDRKVSSEDLAAWREQSSRSFTLRMFPGDHFYLNQARALLLKAVCLELNH